MKNRLILLLILLFGMQSAVAQHSSLLQRLATDYAPLGAFIHFPDHIQTQEQFNDWLTETKKEDFIDATLDLKNGYFSFSFADGPCGCANFATAVAYRKSDGDYFFMYNSGEKCAQTISYGAGDVSRSYFFEGDVSWTEILPSEITRSLFYKPGAEPDSLSIFYLSFDLPREGTRTTIRPRMIPLGFGMDSSGQLRFQNYVEKEYYYDDYQIEYYYCYYIVSILKENGKGIWMDKKEWSEAELDELAQWVCDNKRSFDMDDFRERTIRNIHQMYAVYREYLKLAPKTITMTWNRQENRFETVKIEDTPLQSLDEWGHEGVIDDSGFLQFLLTVPYYHTIC